MNQQILVVHGPNLNLLGEREPEVYGSVTLEEIDDRLRRRAETLGVEVRSIQSNIEGELVEAIQQARGWAAGGMINAGGYSHTSVALHDAIVAVELPMVAVHLSNPHAREPFRHLDLVARACIGSIAGFGWRSYVLALHAIAGHLKGGEG